MIQIKVLFDRGSKVTIIEKIEIPDEKFAGLLDDFKISVPETDDLIVKSNKCIYYLNLSENKLSIFKLKEYETGKCFRIKKEKNF